MEKFSDQLDTDREFEIGGEIFKWRYPYWEEMATIFDADVAAFGNGAEELTQKQNMEDLIQRVIIFLEPENDSIARWKKLSKRKTDPIPMHLYGKLYRWLLEVTSGNRPTNPPSDSEPGGGKTEASSAAK